MTNGDTKDHDGVVDVGEEGWEDDGTDRVEVRGWQ